MPLLQLCLLESIIGDQIEEASSMDLIAKSLKDLTSHGSAEDVHCERKFVLLFIR
jgi:hypothetical protein